jgi:hypothetical protein
MRARYHMTKLDDGQMYAFQWAYDKRGGSKAASERVVRPRSPSTHKSDFGPNAKRSAVRYLVAIRRKADVAEIAFL